MDKNEHLGNILPVTWDLGGSCLGAGGGVWEAEGLVDKKELDFGVIQIRAVFGFIFLCVK